jgi:hypothetical protein
LPPEASGDPANSPKRPVAEVPFPFEFVLPGVIAGVPILLVGLFVALQIAGGAAWLPIVRRWLGRQI